eukprot:7578779-Alexandrium_andersonii.AAC.1
MGRVILEKAVEYREAHAKSSKARLDVDRTQDFVATNLEGIGLCYASDLGVAELLDRVDGN